MSFHLWRPVYAKVPMDDSESQGQTGATAADPAFFKSIIITPPAAQATPLNEEKSEVT